MSTSSLILSGSIPILLPKNSSILFLTFNALSVVGSEWLSLMIQRPELTPGLTMAQGALRKKYIIRVFPVPEGLLSALLKISFSSSSS